MNYGYGYARTSPLTSSRLLDLRTQEDSLRQLAELTERASIHELVRNTAIRIRQSCGSRSNDLHQVNVDKCELEAIFETVKYGNATVPPFREGFAYVADPRFADYFSSPVDTINNCLKGACGGDCDDHTALVAALCASIGFKVGLRAWGRDKRGFSHVYPVVAFPKRPPYKQVVGMDTTVPESRLGWEPPKGHVITAWLHEKDEKGE